MPTKIDWCDETINPLGWGCYGPNGTKDNPQPCDYCYAARMAKRGINKCINCRTFLPHWHAEVFDKLNHWVRPRKIFWQSMGDLFHKDIASWQIKECLEVASSYPQHTHMFLTKNPKRYLEFSPWPANCWLGATACDDTMYKDAVRAFMQTKGADHKAPLCFISAEPLLGLIEHLNMCVNWLIIGQQTGPDAERATPEKRWVRNLMQQACELQIPIWVKDNLNSLLLPGWMRPKEFPQ